MSDGLTHMLEPGQKLVQTERGRWVVQQRQLIQHWFRDRIAAGQVLAEGRGVCWQLARSSVRIAMLDPLADQLVRQIREDIEAARRDAKRLTECLQGSRNILRLPAHEWASIFGLDVLEGHIHVEREQAREVLSFIEKACQTIEYALSHSPRIMGGVERGCLVNWGMVTSDTRECVTPESLTLRCEVSGESGRERVVFQWDPSIHCSDGYVLERLIGDAFEVGVRLPAASTSHIMTVMGPDAYAMYRLSGSGPAGSVSSNTVTVAPSPPRLVLRCDEDDERVEFRWEPQILCTDGYRLLREGTGDEIWSDSNAMARSACLQRDEANLIGSFVLEGRGPTGLTTSNAVSVEAPQAVAPIDTVSDPVKEEEFPRDRRGRRRWWAVAILAFGLCLFAIWYALQHWPPYRPTEHARALVLGGEVVPDLRLEVDDPVLSRRFSLVRPEDYVPRASEPRYSRPEDSPRQVSRSGDRRPAVGPADESPPVNVTPNDRQADEPPRQHGRPARTETPTARSTDTKLRAAETEPSHSGNGPAAGRRADESSGENIEPGGQRTDEARHGDGESGGRGADESSPGIVMPGDGRPDQLRPGPGQAAAPPADDARPGEIQQQIGAPRSGETKPDQQRVMDPMPEDPGFGCNQLTYKPASATSWLPLEAEAIPGGRLVVGVTLFVERGLLTDSGVDPGGRLTVSHDTLAGYGMTPIEAADQISDPDWVRLPLEVDLSVQPAVDVALPLPWAAGIRGASGGEAPMSIRRRPGGVKISYDRCTWRWWAGLSRDDEANSWSADLRVVTLDGAPMPTRRIESNHLRQVVLPTVETSRTFRVDVFDSEGNVIARSIEITLEPGP